MLSSAETIDVIAATLTTHQVPRVVLDPVWSDLFLDVQDGLVN